MKVKYNSQGSAPIPAPAARLGMKAIHSDAGYSAAHAASIAPTPTTAHLPSAATMPAASGALHAARGALSPASSIGGGSPARLTPAAGLTPSPAIAPASRMTATGGFSSPPSMAPPTVTNSALPSTTHTASNLPTIRQTSTGGYPAQSYSAAPAAAPLGAIPMASPAAAPAAATAAPALSALQPAAARILWVDVTRAIAMFFIMWLHVGTRPDWLDAPVGGAICFFFLAAGYFLPRNVTDCARRTVQFAIAWLIWSWSTTILVMIFDPASSFEWSRVFGINAAAYNTPLWFLRNLLIFQSIFLILMCLRILPAMALTVCLICLIWPYDLNGQQHINLLFNWMMAFSAGFALGQIKLSSINALMPKLLLLLAPIAAFLISVDRMEYGFIEAPLFSYAWGAGGDPFVFSLSLIPFTSLGFALGFVIVAGLITTLLPRVAQYLAVVGRNMMFIYAGHTILYGFQIGLNQQLLGGMLGDGIWLPLVAMPVLAVASEALCRYFPSMMTLLGCLSPRQQKAKKPQLG